MSAPDALRAAVLKLAATPRLLVATDFDGTLSPLVDSPSGARMIDRAARALQTLAGCPDTTVCVISGRDLSSLRTVCPPMPRVTLIGGYGAQWEGVVQGLSKEEEALINDLYGRLVAAAKGVEGAFVERKAFGAAINVRLALPSPEASAALDRAHQAAANFSSLTRHLGKGVVEWCIRPTRKGDALRALKKSYVPTLTVALGDDEPDLEAFDHLDSADVRIFVSPLPVHPRALTVPSPHEVARWLESLAAARADATWLHPRREVVS